MKKMKKKVYEEHRAGVTELKSQIQDFKAVKMSLTSTEISLAKTQNDQKGIIDKLNNDIRPIKQEKAKLSAFVTALTNEKENVLPKLDESIALKLKGQQIAMCRTSFGKRNGRLAEDHSGKVNSTKNQETTLQHKQQLTLTYLRSGRY
jgi:hypothetical protein